jgi:formylglycine-generating enzyme required for sulfatase activity
MVRLFEGYCIDTMEVTRSQYQAWLAQNPRLPGAGDANCGFVMAYAPVCDWPYDGTRPDNPVVCVDWCDAQAYCEAMGKQLCGRIGSGPNGYKDYANASRSQWYNACVSSDANNQFPYGNTHQPGYCNGGDNGVRATVPVGSMITCQSSVQGYQGVFDLSGNVWEWEDSCEGTGPSVNCRLRGGGFADAPGELACGSDFGLPRNNVSGDVGFRCCWMRTDV